MKKHHVIAWFFVACSMFVTSAMAQGFPWDPPPPTLPPTCTMSVNPSVISTPGGSTKLCWSTTNATTFSIDPDTDIGSVATSGCHPVTQMFTVWYSGTATGPGGTTTCGVNIGVAATNLTGDWYLQFEKGNTVEEDDGGAMTDFPFSSFNISLQTGFLYQDGSQSYQGTVPGYAGSWTSVWYVRNVHPGHQKYMELYIGIPDLSFGTAVAGAHYINCQLFVEKTAEVFGWGLMSSNYRESEDSYSPGFITEPTKLQNGQCRAWKQTGGNG